MSNSRWRHGLDPVAWRARQRWPHALASGGCGRESLCPGRYAPHPLSLSPIRSVPHHLPTSQIDDIVFSPTTAPRRRIRPLPPSLASRGPDPLSGYLDLTSSCDGVEIWRAIATAMRGWARLACPWVFSFFCFFNPLTEVDKPTASVIHGLTVTFACSSVKSFGTKMMQWTP
jgi:hypothetical protein